MTWANAHKRFLIIMSSILVVSVGLIIAMTAWLYSQQKPHVPYTKLDPVITLMHDENSIAAILKTITPPSTALTESDWQTESSAVKKALQNMTALKITKSAEPVRQATVASLTLIDAAWTALLTAQSHQSASEYITATSSLTAAYQSLSKVTDQSNQAYASVENQIAQ